MKLKIYSTALMAFISLVAYSTANYAQQSPAPPQAPAEAAERTPRPQPSPRPQVYVYDGQASTYTVSADGYYSGSQDTAYRNKMKKLQEQMKALNRQMADLSKEESKKTILANQERMAAMRKTMSARLDSSFSKNFNKNFTGNIIRFNFDADANLLKQVQSGEVKEKSKTFSKSYSVDGNDKLQINNTYGKITVNTWPKNEVKVDVDIKAYANDETEAQKLIDQTTINTTKENDIVSFNTTIDRGDNSSWGTHTENGKLVSIRKMVINYTIYMPAKSALTINNKFGGIILPDLSGKLNIANKYGGLVAKTLSNADNIIDIKYGNADITSLNGSDLSVSYGNLALESADNLTAKINYGPAKIGKLITSGNIIVRYGDGLVIGDIGKNLKSLTVNSSYAPIKLGSLSDANADFDVTVHMGEFQYNNNVNVTSKTPDNERGYTPTKTYKGHIGKGNPEKVITIKTNYGSGVKFQ